MTLLALAASRVAAAPAMPARHVEHEAHECEDDDAGVPPGDEVDEEDDELDDDRCGRRTDEGAFDYLDDFGLERPEAERRLRELEAAAIEELALRDPETGELDELVGTNVHAGSSERDDATERDEAEEPRSDEVLRADAFLLDAEDVVAVHERLLHDPDASLDSAETAAFDDPLVREAIETGSAFSSDSFADASELADLELRHQRPSRWGRLDLTIAWRRAWTPPPVTISLGPLPHGPIAESYDTVDHVLVLATWSR